MEIIIYRLIHEVSAGYKIDLLPKDFVNFDIIFFNTFYMMSDAIGSSRSEITAAWRKSHNEELRKLQF
jgi:hypothetical protein